MEHCFQDTYKPAYYAWQAKDKITEGISDDDNELAEQGISSFLTFFTSLLKVKDCKHLPRGVVHKFNTIYHTL